MKNSIYIFGVLYSTLSISGSVSADELKASVTTDFVTEYVFRGATFAGNAFQPGAKIQYSNFTIGGWASIPVGMEADTFADEYRLFGSYKWNLSDTIDFSTGVTIYHFPESGSFFDIGNDPEDASTIEFFGELDFALPLAPKLSGFYDIDLEAITGIASFQHEYPLTESSAFLVDAEVGFSSSSTGIDYEWGKISTSMNWAFTDSVTAFAKVNWAISSEDLFIDTRFDPDDATTVSSPDERNTWYGLGFKVDF